MEERGLQGVKPYLEKLTLGVTRLLETSPGVTEVMFVEKEPAERHAILSWEQKNACVLPEDLKNFYLMTDGFRMTWNVKFDDNPVSLGCMTINSISKLNRLTVSPAYTLPSAPTLADLEDSDEEEGNKEQPKRPHLDARCLIFELDSCAGNGKVCLVYKNNPPFPSPASEIWFLDRALYWHFLTSSFIAYYRLMITHLGLPQWQYFFTGYGLSPQAKQWFNMYKPITVHTEQLWEADEASVVNKLDPNKVFRNKNKASLVKKRPPTQAAASQKNPAAGGSPRTTSQAGSLSKRRETQP
ncbi:tubulin polyglutamylase complex subunit 2 isoform X1 [Thamnophis elegans]|uniref:tubulin polyglutamylase complex subunit 2 isoform X1 n=1 Tax=Thamnophis elegans TaxID=35005 RepID=UPI001377AB5C|nr:tubulin polyglutamylase complex subunit 2 isoform X1 [Thamnophis elegans]